MKLNKFFTTAALVMAATPAFSANWVYVNTGTNNADNYYDADTMERSGEVVTVWEKADHSRDKTVKWRSSKLLKRFYCSRRLSVIVSIIDYYPNGETKSVNVPPYQQEEDFIAPDTNGEEMLKAVCEATAP